MDTPELRRSALERKDRDELVTIATTLGVKPPSRARKAEIVDLILTTVTTDAADEASGAEPAATPAAQNSAAAPDEEFDFGEVTTQTPRERNDGKGRNRDRSKSQDKANDDGSGAETKESDDGKDGDRNEQKNSNNGGNDEPAGPGNRRPRRRGRGRDQRDDAADGEPVRVEGVLDLRDDGYGFLRVQGWRSSKDDAYVSVKQVRQNGLRKGDHLVGTSRPANRNEKNPALLTLESVNGSSPEDARERPDFGDLTAVYPDEQLSLTLAEQPTATTGRIIDLLAPIGKGSRGLIIAPQRSGATTLLKDICVSIETNNPDVTLILLLIDERPEEVTALGRALGQCEVAASTFDRPADEHVAVADITIERAKRLVESGRDVVIVADGLTRLARAQEQASSSGRSSGGADAAAIHAAKRFFGAARNVEEGGSITIIATASAEESATDVAVLESLRGAATMELRLDRATADMGVHPAVDVASTFARNADVLLDAGEADAAAALQRSLIDPTGSVTVSAEALLQKLQATPENGDLLKAAASGR